MHDGRGWTEPSCNAFFSALQPQVLVIQNPTRGRKDLARQVVHSLNTENLYLLRIGGIASHTAILPLLALLSHCIYTLDLQYTNAAPDAAGIEMPVLLQLEELIVHFPERSSTRLLAQLQPYMQIAKRLHIEARHCTEVPTTVAQLYGPAVISLGAYRFTPAMNALLPALEHVIFNDRGDDNWLGINWDNLPHHVGTITYHVNALQGFAFGALAQLVHGDSSGPRYPNLYQIRFERQRAKPFSLLSDVVRHPGPRTAFVQLYMFLCDNAVEVLVEGSSPNDNHVVASMVSSLRVGASIMEAEAKLWCEVE